MKKIMMTKYGFERAPELDFSDDGNTFTGYRAGQVKISKLVSEGEAYISGNGSLDRRLNYDDQLALPHYRALQALNGVSVSSLTDNDLIKLYNDCLEYAKEYEEAASKATFPTLRELERKENEIKDHFRKEYDEVTKRIQANPSILIKLNKRATGLLAQFITYYGNLYTEMTRVTDLTAIANTAYSHTFMAKNITNSFYYTECLKLLDNIK